MSMSSTRYVGTELDLFAHAGNWKAYLRRVIAPHLHGRVLEVGGGIGATTCAFRSVEQDRWTVLEPDPQLAVRLQARVVPPLPAVQVVTGTIAAINESARFDCILYIDVLEHIEEDAAELRRAATRLATGGVVIVLSPAHQSLYTPFDAAIGHYRRYDRGTLEALTPDGTTLIDLRYLDAVGLALTVGNKLLLRSAAPSLSQIRIWDQWCVPLSRRLDRLTRGRIGKSILAVWRRDGPR
jgi:2-polyprenyl-3-methyl-5-hydroxy-6-metoxy-1,4-benzoquinol methylase